MHMHVPPALPSFSHFTATFIVTCPSSTEDGRQRLLCRGGSCEQFNFCGAFRNIWGVLSIDRRLIPSPFSLLINGEQLLCSSLTCLREKVVVRPDHNISLYRETTQKRKGGTVHFSLQKWCSEKTNTASWLFQK